MKLQIASLAAVSAVAFADRAADICNATCGDVETGGFCEEHESTENNYSKAGFEDAEECAANPCSIAYNNNESWDAAKWHTCEEGSRDLENRKYNHILKMSKALMTTDLSLKSLHRRMQNYGCHCFPGQTRSAGGHGPAVDAQDSLCRDLSRCHRCITMQYGSDQIDVNFDKYRFKIVSDGSGNKDISCQKTSDRGFHQANRDLCECDAHFAREIAKIWVDAEFNDFYWLNPGQMRKKNKGKLVPDVPKFDIDATCVGKESGKADQCCGTYPLRHPYDSNDKACCNNETIYNSVINVCCPGGTVAEPGSC